MKSILLVEDDPVIAEIYRRKLAQEGYQVSLAGDGLVAMKMLHQSPPDLVVLDIMMPKFSGLEVLDHIRAQATLKATKVVVLSNFYISGDEREAATAKADAAFLKSSCTPGLLAQVVGKFLSTDANSNPPPVSVDAAPATPPTAKPQSEAEAPAKIHEEFWASAPATLAELRRLNIAFVGDVSPKTRDLRLLDFYRKVHFVAALAGLAGCEPIALLASAFEALLLELHEKPDRIGPSTIQTIAFTLDFLALLFSNAQRTTTSTPLPANPKVLIVDDDPIASRALSIALRRTNLSPVSAQDPVFALSLVMSEKFDLILLDILLPVMDGLELCKRLRTLPAYQKTPVIFITGHAEFMARAKDVFSGGNDLITKPVLPIELAVKTLTHLLRSQLANSPLVGIPPFGGPGERPRGAA